VDFVRPGIRYRTLGERDRCRGIGPHIDDCDLAPEQLANDLLQRPDVANPCEIGSSKHEYAFILAGDGQRSNRPFVAGESECALYGGALTYVEHPPMVMPRSSALHPSRSTWYPKRLPPTGGNTPRALVVLDAVFDAAWGEI
jgi:hypothetical protein